MFAPRRRGFAAALGALIWPARKTRVRPEQTGGTPMALSLVNVEAVRNAPVTTEPYHYFLGAGLLKDEAVPDLKRDFPAIDKPGYLTVDEVQLKGRFKTLIDELESPEFTEEISRKWGKDMHPYPRLTTIMKKSQPKYGSIHTDGPSVWIAPYFGCERFMMVVRRG